MAAAQKIGSFFIFLIKWVGFSTTGTKIVKTHDDYHESVFQNKVQTKLKKFEDSQFPYYVCSFGARQMAHIHITDTSTILIRRFRPQEIKQNS